MRRSPLPPLLATLLLLTACTSMPQQEIDESLRAPPSLASSEEGAYASGACTLGAWPSEQWWELFGDPQLSALVQRALSDNLNLKKMEAKLKHAEETAREMRSSLYPHLFGNAQDSWDRLSKYGIFRYFDPQIPGVLNQTDLTLNFHYELDFFGRNKRAFQAALGGWRAQEADLAQARLMAALSVGQVYFDLQTLIEQELLTVEWQRAKSALLALTEERQEAGIDDEIERLYHAQELLHLERMLVDLKEKIAIDKHLVNVLIAQGPDEELEAEIAHADAPPPFPLPAHIEVDLIARRPDLMAQLWRVEAAAQQVGAAKARFYPNIDLSALAGVSSLFFNKLFSWEGGIAELAPAFHLPLFTAGELTARLGQKRALFEEAVHAYNELILQAAHEVADAITRWDAVHRELQLHGKSLEMARERYLLTFFRFTEGLDDYLLLLQSEEALIQQRLVYLHLRHAERMNALALVRALGGGYLAPPAEGPPGALLTSSTTRGAPDGTSAAEAQPETLGRSPLAEAADVADGRSTAGRKLAQDVSKGPPEPGGGRGLAGSERA